MGTSEEMCCLIVARAAGWKIAKEFRFVMRSVFEGGAGVESGGRFERSIDRFGVERPEDRLDWSVGEFVFGGVEAMFTE